MKDIDKKIKEIRQVIDAIIKDMVDKDDRNNRMAVHSLKRAIDYLKDVKHIMKIKKRLEEKENEK